jgi:iron complex transport system substrate-binding protein
MKKVCLILSLLIFLTGCGAFGFFDELFNREKPHETVPPVEIHEPEPFPITIDGVEIPQSPQRIISLSPALTEILFEFGFGDRLIAKSEYCDHPREAADIPAIPSSTIDLDLEVITSLDPDLLLVSSAISQKDRQTLHRMKIATVLLPAPQNLEEFRNIYRIIGAILHGGFIGQEEGDAVFAGINQACNNPNVVNIGDFIYITENMLIATGDTLESAILSCFGNNVAQNAAGYVYDRAQLLENQPDVVIINSIFTIYDLTEDEIFSQLDAIIAGRVVFLDNLYFERPSARIITLITEMQTRYKDMMRLQD